MHIYKNNSGYLVISDELGSETITECFLYYSKQEAKRIFKKKYSGFYHKNGHKIK